MVQLMPLPPIISCFVKIQNDSAFLVPAYPDCPEKEAVKQVYKNYWANINWPERCDLFRRRSSTFPLAPATSTAKWWFC